jgi:flagellin
VKSKSDASSAERPLIGAVGTNFTQLIAQRAHAMNALAVSKALYRLSTGSRINSAADDPAGLIAATSLDDSLAQLDAQTDINTRAANQAAVADGFLESVSSLLTDAKSLVAANAGDTLSDAEKQANQAQLDSILDSIDRIGAAAGFNGRKLFNGNGAISAADDSIQLDEVESASIGNTEADSTSYTLADTGSGKDLNIVNGDLSGASDAVDQAISDISTMRGEIGAFSQGVVSSQARLFKSKFYLTSSVSMIRDTDYAMEASRRIRAQLLARAGNYALGFAGAYPGGILSIFA